MDSVGCLWNARYGAGRVIRYDPDGNIEREIILPVQNPTATTFGGPDLTSLIVTSCNFGMSNPDPIEGAMLVIPTDICGQDENWYVWTG